MNCLYNCSGDILLSKRDRENSLCGERDQGVLRRKESHLSYVGVKVVWMVIILMGGDLQRFLWRGCFKGDFWRAAVVMIWIRGFCDLTCLRDWGSFSIGDLVGFIVFWGSFSTVSPFKTSAGLPLLRLSSICCFSIFLWICGVVAMEAVWLFLLMMFLLFLLLLFGPLLFLLLFRFLFLLLLFLLLIHLLVRLLLF